MYIAPIRKFFFSDQKIVLDYSMTLIDNYLAVCPLINISFVVQAHIIYFSYTEILVNINKMNTGLSR